MSTPERPADEEPTQAFEPSAPPPPAPGEGYEPAPEQPAYPQPEYTQPYPPVPPPGYGYPPPHYGQGPAWPPDPSAPWGREPLTGRPYSDKSKLVAGLLQIFVGAFGTGRWYTGSYGIATAQLLTCGGCGVWSLIDGILMLIGRVDDAQGRPLRD
jgi:hypothetical protein